MNKKPFKVLSASALAAVMVSSAIIPAASAATPQAELAVDQVIVAKDGVNLSLSTTEFRDAVDAGLIAGSSITLIKSTDGSYYSAQSFRDALDASANTAAALKMLADSDLQVTDVTVVEGTFVDGVLVPAGPVSDVAIQSVKAMNLATVKVSFNQELKTEDVTKDKFKVNGLEVTKVALADNKKDVYVTVAPGFKYDTAYTVEVKDLADKTLVSSFSSLAVTDIWDLKIEAPEGLSADGVDTGVVTFKLLDKTTGEVDKNANDVVLAVSSTYGYLSQTRVTMQNGVGQVILRSEFQEGGVDAKVEAQVIEAKAGSVYKDLIGKVVAEPAVVPFTVGTEGPGGGTVLLKSIQKANTNEADRVVLTFDEEIEVSDLYTVKDGVPTLKENAVKVSQNNGAAKEQREVVGYTINPDNKKSVTAYLGKADGQYLQDNKDVYVTSQIGKASSKTVSFKFADARKPNLAGVKTAGNNKTLTVTFTEPVISSDFVLDGRFSAKNGEFTVKHGDVTFEDGRFVDRRNEATITLSDSYQEPDKDKKGNYIYPAGFFKPGAHALEASNIFDYAAKSDSNNIGSTQSLGFEVVEDKSEVQTIQMVDSPEQYRVAFDKAYKVVTADGTNSTFEDQVQFQVKNGKEDEWLTLGTSAFAEYFSNATLDKAADFSDFLKFTDLGKNNFKIETTTDWTKVYDTAATRDNFYNDEFRLVLPKEQVITAANGKKNEKDIIMPLTTIDGKGTALATPDTLSPTINDIVKTNAFDAVEKPEFLVTMSEPVKLYNVEDEAGPTLAQNQADLPETKVEFLGKDKDGKTRTFTGSVLNYGNEINDQIIVNWDDKAETPQTLVDAGGSVDWTIVVRSISDDVGNTAATATRNFTLNATDAPAPGDFRVNPTTGSAIGEDGIDNTFAVKGVEGDSIEITFTEAVSVTGFNSATNVKNYALNGKDLPTGASIALKSKDGVDDKTVVISLPEDTLTASNVITLAKNIESLEGKQLAGDVTFTFMKESATPEVPATEAERAALNTAVDAAITTVDSADASDYADGALDTYAAAVTAALAVFNNPAATKADVDAAKTALDAATAAFEKALKEDEVMTFGENGIGQKYTPVAITKETAVSFELSKLPEELKGKTYQLILDGITYDFKVNVGDSNVMNLRVSDTYTQAQIEAAEFVAK